MLSAIDNGNTTPYHKDLLRLQYHSKDNYAVTKNAEQIGQPTTWTVTFNGTAQPAALGSVPVLDCDGEGEGDVDEVDAVLRSVDMERHDLGIPSFICKEVRAHTVTATGSVHDGTRIFICSCGYQSSLLSPCRHIMKVCDKENEGIPSSCIDTRWHARSPDEIERTSNAFWSRIVELAAARTVPVRDARGQRAQRTRAEREAQLQAKFRVVQAHFAATEPLTDILARELDFLFEDVTSKRLRERYSAGTANHRQALINADLGRQQPGPRPSGAGGSGDAPLPSAPSGTEELPDDVAQPAGQRRSPSTVANPAILAHQSTVRKPSQGEGARGARGGKARGRGGRGGGDRGGR